MSKRHLIPSWNLSSGLLISHLASEKMTWMAGRKPEILLVKLACSEYGFSQVVNHGAPLGLMTRAIELSRTFFETLPNEEKLKCVPNSESWDFMAASHYFPATETENSGITEHEE
ncbi:hypothetical protein OIU76_000670 [Salix suchowensis]|nr:hypothetical protein OIU76_000670 [Salix suchowensis]KAJ6387139.1 hypothetical protein OIU78_016954 [Salix suchowensis]